jgi:hypothetical protein
MPPRTDSPRLKTVSSSTGQTSAQEHHFDYLCGYGAVFCCGMGQLDFGLCEDLRWDAFPLCDLILVLAKREFHSAEVI